MLPTELWPPLEFVEANLEGSQELSNVGDKSRSVKGGDAADSRQASADKELQAAYLLLPLTELAQRRASVAAKAFSVVWASGRLVQLTVNGAVMGVLLDRVIQGKQWTGWIAANESNWASAFDVLLEPCDDPFEPMFGVIQAWNPVTLYWSEDLQSQVVCEVSAIRLAAIRAVALECAAGLMIPTPSEPGQIALRTAGGTFSVLTGTPLGAHDVRHDYQNAYRTVAARLMAQQLTQRVSLIAKSGQAVSPCKTPTKNQSAVRWFFRLALLITAIAVIQNMDRLRNTAVNAFGGIATVFQGAAGTSNAVPAALLRVQWKPGVSMSEVQRLLQTTSTTVLDGPDIQGFYSLKTIDGLVAKNALNQSGLLVRTLPP